MAYDDITDAELDAESPVTESLMRKLRDNPVEIADAGSGAPRVRVAALETAQDRADSGTGLATAGMVPVATGGDGAEWDFAAAKGGYLTTTTLGWVTVCACPSGDSYKIDGQYKLVRGAGNAEYYGSISAIVNGDNSGRWGRYYLRTETGVDASGGMDSGLVADEALFRVSSGNIQINTDEHTGGVTGRTFLAFVRVGTA